MYVIKKNKTREKWDSEKIRIAIGKSAERIETTMTQREIERVCNVVRNMAMEEDADVEVKQLHTWVIMALKMVRHDVAQSYEAYRQHRESDWGAFEKIRQKSQETIYGADRENANFNSTLVSTKGSLVRGYLTSEMYQRYYLTPTERQGIKDGFIYIHDMRDLIFGAFNCCLFDMATVLKGGFEMAGVHYSQPKTVLSALQIIGDITLVATAQQYGGFTIPEIDKTLLPYVKASEHKYRAEAAMFGIKEVDEYVAKQLDAELRQGFQSLEMKLNTVPCSRGDTAFVTITFGDIPLTYSDKDRVFMQHIGMHILQTRMYGQKDKSPVVFPKLVYLHSEEQHEKSGLNQELFEEAIKCSSKCMYPDYLSLDNSDVGRLYAKSGKVVSPMGCRAFLSDYEDANGESYFIGRANIGAVSLNLPMIFMDSVDRDLPFYQVLDQWLEVIRHFLRRRYRAISENKASTNPLAFTQGGIRGGNLKPDERIGEELVRQFTASFGVTSLNELAVLMFNEPLQDLNKEMLDQVYDVVYHIEKKVKEFKAEDGYSYALYGTPAESLCGTQLQQFKNRYGVIEGVSDKDFFTNSFHMPVYAEISPLEKQDKEHEMFHVVNGGHIMYVRMDDPNNLPAIHAIVKRGMRMGFYQGVNFELTVCDDCGARPLRAVETCPKCGSKYLTITDRVCGYLGYRKTKGVTRFNDAKMAEVKARKSM